MPEGIWRTEMWHPITVHFPIALLLAATFSFLVSFFLGDVRKRVWQKAASGLLFAGIAAAWIGIYTGDVADGIVAREICDPTVLKDHENASFTMAYLFSAATVLNLLVFTDFIKASWKKLMPYFIFILMAIGSCYLIYTGHLGATLVYQQGAGVIKPTEDCIDFQ
jgi:uncharacterized membrane protein